MGRTAYKNQYNSEHYDRLTLSFPKGIKEIVKSLAGEKHLSVSSYLLDLIRKDQEGVYDSMQIAEKNRDKILAIKGNMHDGYDAILKDGRSFHCRTKLEVRQLFTKGLVQDSESLTQDA